MRSYLLVLVLTLFSFSAYSWNSMGHRVIGEIAYEHLSPQAKEKSMLLIQYLSNAYPYSSTFQTANGWADYLKMDGVHAYDSWHFDNTPYSLDGTPTTPAQTPNLVWALNQSIAVLKNPKTNQYEKAFFIRFLLHLTGDAHQPLHCINFFSKNYPNGDNGGNAEPNHLHANWDNGLGLFDEHCGISPSKAQRAKCFAEEIQTQYPESYFGNKAMDLNPQDWVDESFEIAKTQDQSQTLVKQQLALAGYRLANELNALLG
ncbi:MAG TPA: S1/P1 nuclease [Gammaproteobacteria bacterium]|nr:S1/P1 nuclease [Gammaproteobacteria bacterium]